MLAEVDEYRRGGMALGRDGQVVGFDAATGAIRERLTLFGDTPRATAFARDPGDSRIAVGFEDGTVRIGRLSVGADSVDAELDPPVAVGTSPWSCSTIPRSESSRYSPPCSRMAGCRRTR